MTVEADGALTEGRRWLYFIIVLLCGIAMSMVLMAVSPSMPLLMELYGVGAGVASWFMAVGSLTSMVISLAAGIIQSKINPKGLLLLGTACCVASAGMCMLAGESIALMIAGRLVFGVGMGCANAAGPTLVMALWDDPSKRSIPMAIWACSTAFGSLIILNTFTAAEPVLGGWAAGFAISGMGALIALVLLAFFARIPRERLIAVSRGEGTSAASTFKAIRNPNVILVFVLFLASAFIYSTWSAMSPTYMQTGVGLEPGIANSVASISTLTGIAGSLAAGFVLGRAKNQPLVALFIMILAAVAGSLSYVFTDAALATFESAFIGFAVNAALPAFMLCVQWAVNDLSEVGAAMALTSSFGVGLGGVVSIPIVGSIFDATGSWAIATIPIAIMSAIGILAAAIFFIRCGKKSVAAMS